MKLCIAVIALSSISLSAYAHHGAATGLSHLLDHTVPIAALVVIALLGGAVRASRRH